MTHLQRHPENHHPRHRLIIQVRLSDPPTLHLFLVLDHSWGENPEGSEELAVVGTAVQRASLDSLLDMPVEKQAPKATLVWQRVENWLVRHCQIMGVATRKQWIHSDIMKHHMVAPSHRGHHRRYRLVLLVQRLVVCRSAEGFQQAQKRSARMGFHHDVGSICPRKFSRSAGRRRL